LLGLIVKYLALLFLELIEAKQATILVYGRLLLWLLYLLLVRLLLLLRSIG
jgi:hypothetical protein